MAHDEAGKQLLGKARKNVQGGVQGAHGVRCRGPSPRSTKSRGNVDARAAGTGANWGKGGQISP
jgi:hypothetical protein